MQTIKKQGKMKNTGEKPVLPDLIKEIASQNFPRKRKTK